MSSFETLIAKNPKLFAVLMLALGIANGYLAYTHVGSPLRAIFDGFFAFFGLVAFLLILFLVPRIKTGG